MMTIPYRGKTGNNAYFVTASTFQKKALLQSDRTATLLIETLFYYRDQHKFMLHEFVVMPDHFHLLLTPIVTLERAMQFIKGGFSYRAGKAFDLHNIWQSSFYDRRVRDAAEYESFKRYIHENPVKRRLAASSEKYQYGSACGALVLDAIPQRLKPIDIGCRNRSAEALLHP